MILQNTRFVFGECLKNASVEKIDQSEQILELIDKWLLKQNLLYLRGNVGTGKSYICAALYNELIEKGEEIIVLNEYKFFYDLKFYFEKKLNPIDQIEKICESKYLIFEDIGIKSLSDWEKEMFFAFIDLRCGSGLPTLITSELSANDFLSKYNEKIKSRIYASRNTIIELNGYDRRSRVEL